MAPAWWSGTRSGAQRSSNVFARRQWSGRKRAARCACLGFVFLFAAINAHASLDPNAPFRRFVHQGWQTSQGLPQNSVLSMAQTRDGYLWVGTEEGLARFDGVRFTIFDPRTLGLENNTIQTLLVDHEQNLWVGSDGGGLARYHNGKFTAFTMRNGLPSDSIRALYDDGLGSLWIGTDGGGDRKSVV